jgi:phosphomannomutase
LAFDIDGMVNPKIFKAYDIRGKYPEEINEEAARAVGAAFSAFLKGKTKNIVVGRDGRISSPNLFEALVQGIISQGMDVIDIGICTNPMLIFATKKIGDDVGGIMISASHSPPDINGFKLMGERGVQLADIKRKEIDEKAIAGNFSEAPEKGQIIKKEILREYINYILKFTANIKNLKVVVDYGNGVGSVSGKQLFPKLNIEYIPLYDEIDGNFPNHAPDPHNLENMKNLCQKVMEEKADLGIFFDGDADRAAIVNEQGEIIPNDLLAILLATEELKKYPGGKIYFDLRFTRAAKEIIKENEGEPIMMRVGNPYYKEKMIFENGTFAAEFSGHIFFKENYGIDDGLFAAIMAMNIICKSGKKLSELISPLKRYFASEEINMLVENADKALLSVAQKYKDGKAIDLDGVYIEYPNWWFSLRKSNTEPKVRLRVEANSEKLMMEKKKEIIDLIGC